MPTGLGKGPVALEPQEGSSNRKNNPLPLFSIILDPGRVRYQQHFTASKPLYLLPLVSVQYPQQMGRGWGETSVLELLISWHPPRLPEQQVS